MNIKISAWC